MGARRVPLVELDAAPLQEAASRRAALSAWAARPAGQRGWFPAPAQLRRPRRCARQARRRRLPVEARRASLPDGAKDGDKGAMAASVGTPAGTQGREWLDPSPRRARVVENGWFPCFERPPCFERLDPW